MKKCCRNCYYFSDGYCVAHPELEVIEVNENDVCEEWRPKGKKECGLCGTILDSEVKRCPNCGAYDLGDGTWSNNSQEEIKEIKKIIEETLGKISNRKKEVES